MEFLLFGEKERTPELHAAQQTPVLVDPAQTFPEIAGDLLRFHYGTTRGFVNGRKRFFGDRRALLCPWLERPADLLSQYPILLAQARVSLALTGQQGCAGKFQGEVGFLRQRGTPGLFRRGCG
jgi:hypothetical protein